jgi:D-proline reductase (dithiol) PrdB
MTSMMEMARVCTPYTRLRRNLKDCRVSLVSTCGGYAEGMEPFADNDPTFRLIPDATETRLIHFVPGHFDTSKADIDPNILFPLDRLHDLAAAGEIGQLSEYHVTMGVTTELRRLKEEISWDVARVVLKTRPDVVVLTGG